MNRIQIKFIKDAQAKNHLLEKFEKEFINSLAKRDTKIPLSVKQNSVLNKISHRLNQL